MSRRNHWLDDDDIKPTSKGSSRWRDDDVEDFDPNRDYFTQVVERKQNNMLESTQQSLRMLNESEDVGAATAEELVRQGEVLRRAEQKVDKMEQDLKESDRHLRSIKSLWGAFRNKFSKEPPPSKPSTFETVDRNRPNKLQDAIDGCGRADDERRRVNDHPVLHQQEESSQLYSSSSSSQHRAPKSSADQQVEENLDLMGQSLMRLKGLGLGMQNEIDAQDPVIARLHEKVHNVDGKIHRTNKEMIKLNHS